MWDKRRKDRREEEEIVKGGKKERKGKLFTFTKEGYFFCVGLFGAFKKKRYLDVVPCSGLLLN